MSLHLMDARYCIRVSIASVIALFNCLIKCSKQNTYNWEVELWPKVYDLPLPERSFFRVLLLLFTIKGVTWSVGETNLWYARVRLVGLVGCHSVYTHIARFGCLTFQNTNMSKSFSHFWYSLIAWVLNFETKVFSFAHYSYEIFFNGNGNVKILVKIGRFLILIDLYPMQIDTDFLLISLL